MENTIGNKGEDTRREIWQQPKVWFDTYEIIKNQKRHIQAFLKQVFTPDVDVILTGAGSSAFIGEAIRGELLHKQGIMARPVATTDIVTHPEYYLNKNRKTLLVSFARSGNSPESVAVVDIVNRFCNDVYHLIITCNERGELYLNSNTPRFLRILLPPETNDKSLAMTSSFSSMMLAYILITRIDSVEEEESKIRELCRWIETLLNEKSGAIRNVARLDFKRAVFLGSGPLLGTAHESHLKLQELTDGKVICKFDTFLGFRHGPKAVVNDETIIVYLFSDDDVSKPYEYDLVQQINKGNKGMAQVALSAKPLKIKDFNPDLEICYNSKFPKTELAYLCVAHVVFAQLLGYYKSLAYGLNPDSPSVSGAISRVVEGVTIYKMN